MVPIIIHLCRFLRAAQAGNNIMVPIVTHLRRFLPAAQAGCFMVLVKCRHPVVFCFLLATQEGQGVVQIVIQKCMCGACSACTEYYVQIDLFRFDSLIGCADADGGLQIRRKRDICLQGAWAAWPYGKGPNLRWSAHQQRDRRQQNEVVIQQWDGPRCADGPLHVYKRHPGIPSAQSAGDVSARVATQSFQEPASQPINQPTNQPTNQQTNKQTSQPIKKYPIFLVRRCWLILG